MRDIKARGEFVRKPSESSYLGKKGYVNAYLIYPTALLGRSRGPIGTVGAQLDMADNRNKEISETMERLHSLRN